MVRRRAEEGGCAASEEDGLWAKAGCQQFHFADQSEQVSVHQLAAGRFRVKSAVIALVRAEGDVDIKALRNGSIRRRWQHADNLPLPPVGSESKIPRAGTRAGRRVQSRSRPRRLRSGRSRALNVLGFQTPLTRDDVKTDFIALVERFESLAKNGGVMNEDILA